MAEIKCTHDWSDQEQFLECKRTCRKHDGQVNFDPVNKPKHYNVHPSGLEPIQVTRHMTFNIGNVIKYCWRANHKGGVEDLKKAAWYLADEIKRLEGTP